MNADTRRHDAGKGDTPRPCDPEAMRKNWPFPKKYTKKVVRTEAEGYRFVWFNDSIPDRTIGVDVYRGDENQPFMEWTYARMHGSLMASIAVWRDQALLQAKEEDDERK